MERAFVTAAVIGLISFAVWLPRLTFDRRAWPAVLGFAAYAFADALLTLLPLAVPAIDLLGGQMNWTGKVLALLLAMGGLVWLWRRGYDRQTLGLSPVRWRSLPPIALVTATFLLADFAIYGLSPYAAQASAEQIAYQATMPGVAEEPAYRGVLLAIAIRAWNGGPTLGSTRWSGGALLTCLMFGVIHAVSVGPDLTIAFHLQAAVPTIAAALLFTYARLASGSLIVALVIHNLVNASHYIAAAIAG